MDYNFARRRYIILPVRARLMACWLAEQLVSKFAGPKRLAVQERSISMKRMRDQTPPMEMWLCLYPTCYMTLLHCYCSKMFPQDTPDTPSHFHRIVRTRSHHNMSPRLVDLWSTGREHHRFGQPTHFRPHNTEREMLSA